MDLEKMFKYNDKGEIICNYELNADNTFKSVLVMPVDLDKPTIATKDPFSIKVNHTKLINGEIVQLEPPKPTDKELLESAKTAFRAYRSYAFRFGFDIWEKAVLRGREEDSEDIMNWYQDMLDFPELITKNTTKEDYPEVPQEIKYYL